MTTTAANTEQQAEEFRAQYEKVREMIGRMIVGHDEIVHGVLTAMLCGGHCLLEGVPGLGKTMLVRTLSEVLHLDFNRVQFTPDLMPADILGTNMIVESEEGRRHFEFQKGPVFTQILLADEINRATPKTQSAMLETMQEGTVTAAGHRYTLKKPFFVLATQNPIEQEGTYLLPEAQVDRFMFKLKVGYPTMDEEHIVMQRMASPQPTLTVDPVLTIETLMELREQLGKVFIDPKVERHILRIVDATRNPAKYDLDIGRYLRFGASPRASIYLSLGARGQALMSGRDYTTPQDVKDVAHDILRHRIAISYRAEAEGLNSDDLLDTLLKQVPITEA